MRYSSQLCLRFQRAMDILGKRWTALIIKVLLDSPLRFNELSERLQVVSDRVLSERLKELEAEGLVARHVVPEKPVRVEYSLTEKGYALAEVIEAVQLWSDRWIEGEMLELQQAEVTKGAH